MITPRSIFSKVSGYFSEIFNEETPEIKSRRYGHQIGMQYIQECLSDGLNQGRHYSQAQKKIAASEGAGFIPDEVYLGFVSAIQYNPLFERTQFQHF